jgi:TrmH family RNA methyltransferase
MRKPNEKNPYPVMTFGPRPNLINISVILVEPATAGNVGSVARAMKTMGLTDLVVVNGVKFKSSPQTTMMGHGSRDVIDNAREIPTWEEAIQGIHWLVGTTHRKRRPQFPQIVTVRESALKIAELSQNHRVGVVFGREETGLTDAELRQCHDITSVPQCSEHPSLNLSQAVMIVAYEIFLASLGEVPKPKYNLAEVPEVEALLQHMATSLAQVGFRPHQGDPESFLRSLRRVISRAPLERRDCNVLHRVCQQIEQYVKDHGGPRE